MAKKAKPDRLMGQLMHLPSIVGELGRSIASAQTQLNADYVDRISTLMALIKETLPQGQGGDQALRGLLEALAPSRYQFTETVIEFSADLSESFDARLDAAMGFGMQAVMVNAGVSIGYGYDYRAAARVKSTLHAFPVGKDMATSLLDRAAKIDETKLELPERTQIEDEIHKGVAGVRESLKNAVAVTPGAGDKN